MTGENQHRQWHAGPRMKAEDSGHGLAAWNGPPGDGPGTRAARRELETGVDRPVADGAQVDGDRCARTPAARGQRGHVTGGAILEGRRVDPEGRRAADDWLAPLELVDGEVHALPEKSLQRALDAIPGDEPFEVSELASGRREQHPVRMLDLRVDATHDAEEGVLPGLEPSAERHAGLCEGDGMANEPRQPAEEAHAGDEVVSKDHRDIWLSNSLTVTGRFFTC